MLCFIIQESSETKTNEIRDSVMAARIREKCKCLASGLSIMGKGKKKRHAERYKINVMPLMQTCSVCVMRKKPGIGEIVQTNRLLFFSNG